jgi:hypothetical protein
MLGTAVARTGQNQSQLPVYRLGICVVEQRGLEEKPARLKRSHGNQNRRRILDVQRRDQRQAEGRHI